MKKSVVFVSLSLALVGAGFATNSIMIKKAGEEIPLQVLNTLQSINPGVAQVQLLSSSVDGKNVEEEYLVYFLQDGKRLEAAPLYLTHTAEISPFALSIDGKFSIVKDKGLAKRVIEDFTTFNDDIGYNFSTATGEIDLTGLLQIDDIKEHTGTLRFGDLSFAIVGQANKFTYNANLPSIVLDQSEVDFSMSDFAIEGAGGDINQRQVFDGRLGEIRLLEKQSNDGFEMLGARWNSSLSSGDKANLNTQIGVEKLKFNIAGAPKEDLSAQFTLHIEGVQRALFEELLEIFAGDMASSPAGQRRAEEIVNELLCAGLNANEINFRVNGSSIKGYLFLAPSNNDYIKMPSYEQKIALISKLSSEFDFVVEQSLVESLPDLAPMIQLYFQNNGEGQYTARVSFTGGQLLLNGQRLF